MPSRNRPKHRRYRSAGIAWEMAFDAEVRRLPTRHQTALLRRKRRWLALPARPGRRHRSPRIFWVLDPTGDWYFLL